MHLREPLLLKRDKFHAELLDPQSLTCPLTRSAPPVHGIFFPAPALQLRFFPSVAPLASSRLLLLSLQLFTSRC